MTEERWLICGTRLRGYGKLLCAALDREIESIGPPEQILEGCCPESADQYAEQWAKSRGIDNQHYPSTTGSYLTRNIQMVEACTRVFAFWDGFSYGSAHTIATAVSLAKPVKVFRIG